MDEEKITDSELMEFYEQLKEDTEQGGYHLNPKEDFTLELVKGMLVNKKRYGYPACPCRLSSGKRDEDLDIICPCDYRDDDLNDYGQCYCGLYVSREVVEGLKDTGSIPERRPVGGESHKESKPVKVGDLSYPVWRCKVCGYLCANNNPPGVCPICKAKKERFERFM
ncbi:ferredoxin:glutaredoxin reductase [bacterium]|nr:ferredoxin:glutaredoxin reductase [bacterium]